MNRTNYPEWLRMAAVGDVPVRYDMPAEPNYCHDCTPEFKKRAISAGTCLFPNVRFEVRKADGEKETIGVSRSGEMPPDGYVIYQHMTVPSAALADQLRRYVQKHKIKTLTQPPKRLRGTFATITGTNAKVNSRGQ